jgi:choline-sulfatase
MRLLYIDIDTQRADHLGCYGYHRPTSPNIDEVAATGARFDEVYASDTPCLPSRTALITGRFGIRNGVVNHGGNGADPFLEGPARGFQTATATNGWVRLMRSTGMRTATVSSFGERHSAYHWYAGFNDVHNLGHIGEETADMVASVALEWLGRHGREDSWFLHVHMWDPHTPYRTPSDYGDPFADMPLPSWLDEGERSKHWDRPGPHSAREVMEPASVKRMDELGGLPRQPRSVPSMTEVRQMFDGYDTGVRFSDAHVARILNLLADLDVLDETAVMISGDHGETLGELGIYCDHQTVDYQTARLPMIIRWPGAAGLSGGRVQRRLAYQIDVAATILELLGVPVPDSWDGQSFASSLDGGDGEGRDHVVTSTGAWTAQRGVRFGEWLCIRTYHDGYHGFPPVMLFDVAEDPHQQVDLSAEHPDVVDRALAKLSDWQSDALSRSPTGVDPLWAVLHEGGPYHARTWLQGDPGARGLLF